MNNFVKIGNLGDEATLLALASIQPHHWKEDTYLRDYPQGPFGETESVILRFPPRTVHETEQALKERLEAFDQHENVWQPVAAELPLIKDLAFNLMRSVNGTRLGRVMVNKMEPGGKIFRHADTPVHANYWSRFHIVLHALPGVFFDCGDECVQMLTGDVYFFRNELEHEIVNHSTDPRVHLVVDIKVEEIK